MQSVRYVYRLRVVNRHIASMAAQSNNHSTAGIIVIGDEILKGQTADTNSHFICKHLYSMGVKVQKISVIPDDLSTIASEVAEFSQRYTHVITSGGIGPTHDDVTFEGVAKAFKEDIIPHPDLVELIKKYFNTEDLKSPKMKMAYIPRSAKIQYGVNKTTGERTRYPLVSVHNVYMFPGIPSILEHAFVLLKDNFCNPGVEFHSKYIYVNLDEVSITSILNEVDSKFKEHVVLGSYPDINNSYYKVKLTLESLSPQHLEDACNHLKTVLPPDCIVDFDTDPVQHAVQHINDIVKCEGQSLFNSRIHSAVQVIEECLDKYRLDEVCVGFNGGKDCTVLLHLFHAVARRKFPDYKDKLKALYIRSKLPFPEVEKFIQLSRDRYNLEMLHFNGRIRNCLGELQQQHPVIKAVVMGTRQTDPFSSGLTSFTMTDSDWPQFMRVNPILDWTYHDIWHFLRSFSLPYCSLYDRGYTSLGSMNNTHPNPTLQYIDKRGIVCYKPAYQLEDSSKERDGRNK
ncbi:FAD synthase-like [Gigantopelta aegis]|uniref:FAD synthase-like n=1 Tax=Gigantopelta aegis TaxID=1735272 RepID=UPI001B8890E8|nr:FAD synthase-like [Gigantopelta aegis]